MEQLAFSVVTDQHGGIIVNCPAHPMIDNSDIDAQFSKYSDIRPLIWPC